jgi:predicted aspartyl protease
MPTLKKNGTAVINIKIKGVYKEYKDEIINTGFNGYPQVPFKEYKEAIIDTGFDGYIQIPFLDALPLGLITSGIGQSMFANGETGTNLICQGFIEVADKEILSLITLSQGNQILIGTQFLQEIKANLIFDFIKNKYTISFQKQKGK